MPSDVISGRVIGAVVPDPRRAGSVRVMVDGRPLLTVPRDVAERERLGPGLPLEEPLLTRLGRAADEEAAFRTALRLLERRPFAARDLARRLVLKGHSPDAADAARCRATELGLLDDRRFSAGFVETRAQRGRGPMRLRRDLAVLGVERAVIDGAIAEVFGADGADAPQADALARRRIAQLRGLSRTVQRRRLLA
ncbi:MAG TPA: regulatory protein RecX, partial [Gemmatimonadales bacterium]